MGRRWLGDGEEQQQRSGGDTRPDMLGAGRISAITILGKRAGNAGLGAAGFVVRHPIGNIPTFPSLRCAFRRNGCFSLAREIGPNTAN